MTARDYGLLSFKYRYFSNTNALSGSEGLYYPPEPRGALFMMMDALYFALKYQPPLIAIIKLGRGRIYLIQL